MSSTTITIKFPSVNASTTTPNIFASSNNAGVIISAQPAGFPAIPGLYKRIDSASSINSILKIAASVSAISDYSSVSNKYIQTLPGIRDILSTLDSISITNTFKREVVNQYTSISVAAVNISVPAMFTTYSVVESKSAFTSNYFQDLTYTAPTQYVGILTLI